MKIERITKKTLLEIIRTEQLGPIEDHAEIIRKPGVRGIGKTKAGNYMVYCVDDAGKLYNTSVHTNKREANGRLLERLRATA